MARGSLPTEKRKNKDLRDLTNELIYCIALQIRGGGFL